jgi:hypothetical protein
MAKQNNQMTGWVGWIGFASFMLLLGGAFSIIAGFVALTKETVVYHAASNNTWVLNYDQWGWIHILAGVLLILAAGSLMSGSAFGRIVAVVVAFLSAVANMAFIPVYPFWSIMVITIDLLVIWAVTVHGSELKD